MIPTSLSLRITPSRILVLACCLILIYVRRNILDGLPALPKTPTQAPSKIMPMADRWMAGKKLRILPLGDSLTEGYRSSHGNGYRAALHDLITQQGISAEWVGSLKGGSMSNNNHEGWGGTTIEQITKQTSAYDTRPNAILVLAGMNDADQNLDVSQAGKRLDDLVSQLQYACPDATILVGSIPGSTKREVMSNIQIINRDIVSRMQARVNGGQHIVYVDLAAGFDVETHMYDWLHPNDHGYQHMANAWANGLHLAADNGWIASPIDTKTSV